MSIIYIDGHCDSLEVSLDKQINMRNSELEFNFKDANKITPCIQICAAFVGSEFEDGFNRALDILKRYNQNRYNTILIKDLNDIKNVIDNKKVGVLLSIENGKAINNDLDNIDLLYDIGVRMMGVTWNDDNLLGCGAFTNKDNGLTELGKKYIKKLVERKIIVDVSHCSNKTFWDICNETDKMIVASHSCCKSICNHCRNLDDNQVKEIAKREGIIGICLSAPFLNENEVANVDDIINHIKYIVDLVGPDYVGLGSDFDGVIKEHKLQDVKNINDIYIIENKLKMIGYNKKVINKIMWENWMRVIKANFK